MCVSIQASMRWVVREGSPAATDVEQAHPRLQLQLLADQAQLVILRGGQPGLPAQGALGVAVQQPADQFVVHPQIPGPLTVEAHVGGAADGGKGSGDRHGQGTGAPTKTIQAGRPAAPQGICCSFAVRARRCCSPADRSGCGHGRGETVRQIGRS